MATYNIFLVLLCFALEGLANSLNFEVCTYSDMDIIFPKQNTSHTTAVVWRKKLANILVPVASLQTSFKGIGDYKNRVEELPDYNIRIKNVSRLDEGEYTRQVHNGAIFTDKVTLSVYEPPRGLPSIDHKQDKDGIIILTCNSPQTMSLGYPKTGLIMKDSGGRIQDSLTVTVNDRFYQCCMTGPALQCLEPGANVCANFTTPISYRSELICKTLGYCIGISFIYWIVGIAVLKLTTMFMIYFIGKQPSIFARKWKLHLIQIFFSVAILIIVSLTICTELPDCHKKIYHLMIGLGSAFTIIFPTILLSSLRVTHTQKLSPKKRVSRLNTDIGRCNSVLALIQYPFFGICTKANGNDEQRKRLLDFQRTVNLSDIDCSKNRKYARRFKRVEILKKGLQHKLMNNTQKAEINRILTPDYMSSEESDYEEENGSRTLVAYKVKRLPWLNKGVEELKKSLISAYQAYERKPLYEDADIKRTVTEETSDRKEPQNIPEWAKKDSDHPFLGFLT